jgi:hypothetical protein
VPIRSSLLDDPLLEKKRLLEKKYGIDLKGPTRDEPETHTITFPPPPPAGAQDSFYKRQKVRLERIMPGLGYTFEIVADGGAVSIITAVIALAFGALVVWWTEIARSKNAAAAAFSYVLLTPIIGCCFLWLLLHIMGFAGRIFGGVLSMAESWAAVSTGLPTIFGLIFSAVGKEREHHITSNIMKRIVGDRDR